MLLTAGMHQIQVSISPDIVRPLLFLSVHWVPTRCGMDTVYSMYKAMRGHMDKILVSRRYWLRDDFKTQPAVPTGSSQFLLFWTETIARSRTELPVNWGLDFEVAPNALKQYYTILKKFNGKCYRKYKQTFTLLKIHTEIWKLDIRQNVKFWPFLGNATSRVQIFYRLTLSLHLQFLSIVTP